MLIITLTYCRPLTDINAAMAKHVAWLKRHYRDGTFIASGRQKPRVGGIILARSDSLDAIAEIMAGDPFVAKGLATYAVTEFIPSMTAQGADALRHL